MPKNKKKEKILYDFDYAEKEEQKKKKRAEKRKKSASKKRAKIGQAGKKYEEEIIIGVTKIPEKENKKKLAQKQPQKKKNKKESKKEKKSNEEKIRTPIYNYDQDELEKSIKKEKINKKIKLILKVLLCLIILIGIVCLAFLSPIFNIQNIEVTGTSKLSKDEIISLSGITKDENIFKVLNLVIENNIKQNAYIEDVKVIKHLPSSIEIAVTEREPKFLLEFGNGYVYLNNQGYMIDISNERLNIPIIKGSKTEQEKFVVGNRLESEDLEKLGTAIRIMDIAENNDISELITSIDISNENNYKLYLESEKKTAYLGDCSNLETRILYMKAIIENEKNIEGEIFIDMNLNSENAFFREAV